MIEEETLRAVMDRVGYEFQNLALLEEALRHSSYTHEHPGSGPHNQRLEFLGDAALGLVVADGLIRCYPDAREGDLTRWRAALVSERPLARIAKTIDLGEFLALGHGEDVGGGRQRTSVLADGVEALVGAAFLDGGIEAARSLVEILMGERLRRVAQESRLDPKSRVQEQLQSGASESPVYRLIRTTGPEHAKRFEVELRFGEEVLGRGEGASKKGAEKAAAIEALENLRQQNEETP